MCHHASIRADYEPLRKVCSTSSLSLSTYVIYLIPLAVCRVLVLSHSSVVDRVVGALDATWETRNELRSALESQVASKNAEIIVKVAQVDSS